MKKLILSAACSLFFIGYAAGQKSEAPVKQVAAKEEVKKTDSKGKKESKGSGKKAANTDDGKLVLPAVVVDSTADVPKDKSGMKRRR